MKRLAVHRNRVSISQICADKNRDAGKYPGWMTLITPESLSGGCAVVLGSDLRPLEWFASRMSVKYKLPVLMQICWLIGKHICALWIIFALDWCVGWLGRCGYYTLNRRRKFFSRAAHFGQIFILRLLRSILRFINGIVSQLDGFLRKTHTD